MKKYMLIPVLSVWLGLISGVHAGFPPVPEDVEPVRVDKSLSGTGDFYVWAEGGYLYLHVAPEDGVFFQLTNCFTVIQNEDQYNIKGTYTDNEQTFSGNLYVKKTFRLIPREEKPFDATEPLKLIHQYMYINTWDIIPRDAQPVHGFPLETGWNLIGFTGPEAVPAQAFSLIADKITAVWGFKNGRWQLYDPLKPDFNDLASLEPGYGYWVHVKEPCEWVMP